MYATISAGKLSYMVLKHVLKWHFEHLLIVIDNDTLIHVIVQSIGCTHSAAVNQLAL